MKKSKLLLLVALVFVMVCCLVACDPSQLPQAQPPHEHTFGDWSLLVAPTTEVEGQAVRFCECNGSEKISVAVLTDETVWTATSTTATHESAGETVYTSIYGTVTVAIDRLTAHVYDKEVAEAKYLVSAADCENAAVYHKSCSCGAVDAATFTVGTALGHTAVATPAAEATCVDEGNVAYWTCSVCNKLFSDEACTTAIALADTVVAKVAHVYDNQVIDAKYLAAEADCTNASKYYYSCDCGAIDGTTFANGDALGHTTTAHPANDATCTVDGNRAYWSCSACDGLFGDELCKNAVTANWIVIPATGHTLGTATVVPATCTQPGSSTRNCACGHVETAVIPATGHVAGDKWQVLTEVDESWDDNGGVITEETVTEYCAPICSVCDAVMQEQAQLHSYTENVLVGRDDSNGAHGVNYQKHCLTCGHLVTEEVNAPYVFIDGVLQSSWTEGETVPATYAADGYTIYTYQGLTYKYVLPRLVAPFENVTYSTIEFGRNDSKAVVAGYHRSSANFTVAQDGTAKCTSAPFGGDILFTMVDDTHLTITVTKSDSTSVYHGSIDANGIIAFVGDRLDVILLTPYGTQATKSFGASFGDNMVVSYYDECVYGSHFYNVYTDGDDVVMNVTVADLAGNAVNASNCLNADGFTISANGAEVVTFVHNNGELVVSDGFHGTYAGALGNLVVSGCGTFVLDVTYYGTYAQVEGGFDAFVVVDGKNVQHYFTTIDTENMTYALQPLQATVTLIGNGYAADGSATVYTNCVLGIEDLQSNNELYLFAGWALTADGEVVGDDFVVTEDTTLFAKWTKRNQLFVVDAVGGNSEFVYGAGDVIGEMVPNNYVIGNFYNGDKVFGGWFADENYETVVDMEYVLSDEDSDLTIYAKWNNAGTYAIECGAQYTFVYNKETSAWVSNNQAKSSSEATLTIIAVGGPIEVNFDYWASGEKNYDYIKITYKSSVDSYITVTKVDKFGTPDYTAADAQEFAIILQEGELISITYRKDGSGDRGDDTGYVTDLTINGQNVTSIYPYDGFDGDYTAQDDSVVTLDGYRSIVWGELVGSYTQVEGNNFEVIFNIDGVDTYYNLVLGEGTCTITPVMFTVTYQTAFGTVENASVAKNATIELPVLSDANNTFRGWYVDGDEMQILLDSNYTVTGDVTLVAKWDAKLILTVVYGQGLDNDTIEYGAGDLTAPVIPVRVGDLIFSHWYVLVDGQQVEYVPSEITESLTIYCAWKDAPAFFGKSYSVLSISSSASVSSTMLTIDDLGNAAGVSNFLSGKTLEFVDRGNGLVIIIDKTSDTFKYFKAYYDATTGMIIKSADNSGASTEEAAMAKDFDLWTIYALVESESVLNKSCFTVNNFAVDGYYYKVLNYVNGDINSNVLIADSVYYNVSFNDLTGAPVAIADCSKANSLIVSNASGVVARLAYNGSAMVVMDATAGVFANGEDTIVFNGARKYVYTTNGTSTTGNYIAFGNVYTMVGDTTSFEATVDTANGTYTIQEAKALVSFNTGDPAVVVEPQNVYKNILFTLPAGPTRDGFIFRGWYLASDFSGSRVTRIVPTEDTIVYGKYDPAVTLTYNYNGQGTADVVVDTYFANDKIGTLQTVNETFGEMIFAGWFTMDGTNDNYGDQVTNDTVLTANTTVYAKWMLAHPMYGEYKGFEIWSTSSGTGSVKSYKVDEFGKMTGAKEGTIQYNAETGAFELVKNASSTYYGFFDAANGFFAVSYSTTAGTLGNDVYYGFKGATNVSISSSNMISWNGNKTRIMKFTVDGADNYVFINDTYAYANVVVTAVANGQTITEVNKFNTEGALITITTAQGAPIAAYGYVGGAFVENDGKAGTYAGSIGSINVTGFGTLTIDGGDSVVYTVLDNGNLTFVANDTMHVIALDGSAYTAVQDGFEGEYTLPDGTSKITLDGFGGAGEGATYVVNGTTITIYTADDSNAYGIDVETKTLSGKSIFAGLTFTGEYYNEWDEYNQDLKIIFDDSTAISGVMYSGWGTSYYFNFTGELNGNTLTLTITKAVSGNSDVGKTLVATVSGNTITFTSAGTWNSNTYTFDNNGSVSCSDFAGI